MEDLTLGQKKTVLLTVAAVLFFAAVNQTIVGTSLPRIVASLGHMEYFSWIFTVYMFASSLAALAAGKLSDHYGRKAYFFAGIAILMVASFLCGLADSMLQLIFFRGLQGIGGGILISLSFASVADLFHPRERGKWQGLLTATFGLSSLVGPTLGGVIIDSFHWRWIFWMFLPLGIAAFFILRRYYPADKAKEHALVWDIQGFVYLAVFLSAILLALTFAGRAERWLSTTTACVFFALFIRAERKAVSPILPLKFFMKNNFAVSNLAGFLLGMAMFGVIIYIPFFLQGVMQMSGARSGILMMSMTICLVTASAFVGRAITATGHYKLFGLMGVLLMAAGMGWMSQLTATSSEPLTLLRLITFGIGLGTSFTVSTFAVQLDVGHQHAGLAMSVSQLFRQIGGTIGVSVFGGLFAHLLSSRLGALRTAGDLPATAKLFSAPRILLDPHQLAALRESLTTTQQPLFDQSVDAARDQLAGALDTLFLYGCALLILALLALLFLHEYPLKDEHLKEKIQHHEAT